MKRREFIAAIAASTVWPLASRAQQSSHNRKIAALWPFNEGDAEGRAVVSAFREGLRELGWGDIRIESRWAGGNLERTRAYAEEIVAL
jgi:hypothetical protein